MNFKRLMIGLLALILCVSLFAACGKQTLDEIESATSADSTDVDADLNDDDTAATTEDATASHPVLPYVGTYAESQTGRGTVEITCKDTDSAYIVIRWTTDAAENCVWNMSGAFDAASKTITYADCRKTQITYSEDGNSASAVVYERGKGCITFTDDGLTWDDQEEQIAAGAVFVRV